MSIETSYMQWKAWDRDGFAEFGEEQSLYYRKELQASGIKSVRGLRVGEIGFGNGEFAGWVRANKGAWIGSEAIPDLRRRATEAGFDVVAAGAGLSNAGPGQLDVIVAFDVIEHLRTDDVRAFLADSRVALRDGGCIVIRCPSGDSPFASAIYNGDLTHRTLLGSSAVRHLAMEAGLEVVQIRSPVVPVWGLGIRRATVRALLLPLRRLSYFFVRNVLIGRRAAVLSPNMVVLLRKPR